MTSIPATIPNVAERVQDGRERILTQLRRVIVGQDEVVDQVREVLARAAAGEGA